MENLILAGIILAVLALAAWSVLRKKKKGGSCCGCCSGCKGKCSL